MIVVLFGNWKKSECRQTLYMSKLIVDRNPPFNLGAYEFKWKKKKDTCEIAFIFSALC
jgi:hypothetical protein